MDDTTAGGQTLPAPRQGVLTDLDVQELLTAIGGWDEVATNDNIQVEGGDFEADIAAPEPDADQEAGADEISNLLELAAAGSILTPAPVEEDFPPGFIPTDLTAVNREKLGAGSKQPDKAYEAEPTGTIDPQLTKRDLMTIILCEIKRKKIAGHHIDSMNSFARVGIEQIATKIFTVEHRMKNLRDLTEEDRDITEISFKVEFKKVEMTAPTTPKYKSGTSVMLTPNHARMSGLTYSSQLYMSAVATATAYKKDGSVKEFTVEVGAGSSLGSGERIAGIPCLVGSDLCHTSKWPKATLKRMQEDPTDSGGYFIINGGEWVVDNLENITNNSFHVYKNMFQNEIARGQFISKPGDAFENSYQVIMRYKTDGSITMEITISKTEKIEMPYYLFFRALGMNRDRDIINHIVYGVDNEDPVTVELKQILERAFDIEDSKYRPIQRSTSQTEIVNFIGRLMIETANNAAARKDDNVQKYLNINILQIFDRNLFPHIGTLPKHRISKLRFLGHLINRLLGVYMGILEPTDRDSYKNKRVYSAGTSLAKAFKTHFNFAVAQELKKHLIRDFRGADFTQVCKNMGESIKGCITNSEELERMLVKSISSGNKVIKVKRNDVTNRVSSQTLYHKNDMNVKSTVNTVNTPNTTASKQNERADEMRRVQPTYPGFIDISQSHDSGEKVGMTKQMACTASVCSASSSYILKRKLQDDPDIFDLDNVSPEDITLQKLSKVFVNGDWIGCCNRSHDLVVKYRTKRRHGDIHHLTTIVWEPLVREVYFWTDVGRLMRPLLIVYNNLAEYIMKVRGWKPGPNGERIQLVDDKGQPAGDKNFKFRQWIKLTKSHITGLQTGKVTMDDLRKERIIEYISPEEQESTYISPNIEILRQHEHDVRAKYTHCDIDQAIFGIVTLAAPKPECSNAVRNTYYTNHRKQSSGWYTLNFPFRMDKNVTLQHNCEKPLITTFSDALTCPNGQNTIVALILHRGMNQEDSIEANQSSVDCGMFNASYYNYESTKLEKDEMFGNIDYTRTMDIKKDATYEYVENGFISKGTKVKKGYVLIVKVAKIPKPTDQYLFIDKSIVYKKDDEAYIEQSIAVRNNEQAEIGKVRWREDRPLAPGDKCSSRTGNKGIIGSCVPRNDMPYCSDGLVPDLLVNAHSIPTRMAVNQIIECVMAQLAVARGAHIDATAFIRTDVDDVLEQLEKNYGVKYGGHRQMWSGESGCYIDTLIFIGPTTYQRLQKFAKDEQYAIRSGPTSALTRQPLDGKNNDGGLRLGEMEKDVFCAHGCMESLFEKFYDDSDGMILPICRICGNRAVVNEKRGLYKCKYCGDNADIANVHSAWVANVLFNETSAMNVKAQFELEPYTYSRPQVE